MTKGMLDIYNKTVSGDWITEPTTDTQYAIEETDDSIIVKFQGSVSKLDWLQNFSFWKKPYHNMSKLFFVHSGFLKKYKSVKDQVILKIRTAVVVGKSIEIRGYSQGAALAMLCHEDVYFNTGVQPDTIVFGCPRVFSFWNNKELKKRLSGVTRIENGGDIVTGLPPFIMGFKHYGIKQHIGKKKLFKLSIKDHLTYRENI